MAAVVKKPKLTLLGLLSSASRGSGSVQQHEGHQVDSQVTTETGCTELGCNLAWACDHLEMVMCRSHSAMVTDLCHSLLATVMATDLCRCRLGRVMDSRAPVLGMILVMVWEKGLGMVTTHCSSHHSSAVVRFACMMVQGGG